MRGKIVHIVIAALLFVAGIILISQTTGHAEDIPRMTVETLEGKLGMENIVIVDARSGSDWRGSEFIIPGAVRGKAGAEAKWAKDLDRNAEIVVYCA